MMKIVLGLLFLVTLAYASNVVVLTPENIDSYINNENTLLVKFYAPWCGHCKRIAPEYEAAAEALKDTNVILAEADCDAHREIGEKYGIQGFPTLFFFEKGQKLDYTGGRTKDEIESWVRRIIVSSLSVVTSAAQLKPSGSSLASIVLFGETDEKTYNVLLHGAKFVEDLAFVQVKDAGLTQSEGATSGTVRVYKNDGTHQDVNLQAENLFTEISNIAYPKIVEFSQAQFKRAMQTKSIIILGFAPYEDATLLASLKDLLNAAANVEANNDCGFLFGDSTAFAQGLQNSGASLKFLPTVIALYNQKQYVWDEEIALTSASFNEWISLIPSGTASSNKKSEPIPESNDGAVVKLVYKNYNQYLTSGKPIFVKYYAPWCGHCKNMQPDWVKLGEEFKGKGVTIAEYDATANYSDVEQIEGFPTLVFYDGKGGKEFYNQDRTYAAMSSFVKAKLHGHSHDEL